MSKCRNSLVCKVPYINKNLGACWFFGKRPVNKWDKASYINEINFGKHSNRFYREIIKSLRINSVNDNISATKNEIEFPTPQLA